MADAIFEDPRLVEIYDTFDGERDDLIPYLEIAREFNASSIIDIGSGTGCFSCLLASKGYDVIGVEPAKSSLEKARSKQHAEMVEWVHGDMTTYTGRSADMAVMTGNVAQVFLDDHEWNANLEAIRHSLNNDGYFVFEVRDPSQKAWKNWTKENTKQRYDIPKVGIVEGWCEVKAVTEDLVTFVWTYHFHQDDKMIQSQSTLRFRDKDSIIQSLEGKGFDIIDVRDAPDRPKKEFVFIAQKRK